MKSLPKVEVRYRGSRRQYFINGIKVKPIYGRGVRPKIILKELGLIIKFNHKFYYHDDKYYYKKFGKADRRYFPKLYVSNSEYSIHEYVDSIPLPKTSSKVKAESMQTYWKLAYKYDLEIEDVDARQAGLRKKDRSLVIFDYGIR